MCVTVQRTRNIAAYIIRAKNIAPKNGAIKNHLISDIKSRGFRVVMLSGARLKTYSISGFYPQSKPIPKAHARA